MLQGYNVAKDPAFEVFGTVPLFSILFVLIEGKHYVAQKSF